MDGALSMELLRRLSGTPVLFSDLRHYHAAEDLWHLSNSGQHATWFAARSDDPDENMRHVHLCPQSFYFPAGGASVHHLAAPGDFTFARLTRGDGSYRMHVLRGEIEVRDAEQNEALMRQATYEWPHAFARIDADPATILGRYASNHVHAVPGDYVAELRQVCYWLGIDFDPFGFRLPTPAHVMKRGGLLGIDIGTSSSKGVLVDDDGRVLASAVRPHCVSLPQAGWAEHDPDTVWWRDFCSISRSLVGETHLSPGCVAVSGIGPCLLPGDADGAALRPAILYGVDTRATAEIAELAERYGSSRILDRCGSVLSSQAVGPKLLWLRGNEPDVWARTRKLFTAQSHVVYRLTGAYVIDHHSASQCTPLYDVHGA